MDVGTVLSGLVLAFVLVVGLVLVGFGVLVVVAHLRQWWWRHVERDERDERPS